MGIVKTTHPHPGGSSHGTIVRATRPDCPVRLHLLGSHCPPWLPRAAPASREPDLFLPRRPRRRLHRPGCPRAAHQDLQGVVRGVTDEAGIPVVAAPPAPP